MIRTASRGGERAEVLEGIRRGRSRGNRFAVATVMAVQGSSYRGPGARLVVGEDRSWLGGVSAGCLEEDVAREAERVMAGGIATLLRFDTADPDEATFGWGLGCQGVIDILIEPASDVGFVETALAAVVEDRQARTIVSVARSSVAQVSPGFHLVLEPAGTARGSSGAHEVDGALVEAAEVVSGPAGMATVPGPGGTVDALVEHLTPIPRLVVCGAGRDVPPLTSVAASLGWDVTVVEDRAGLLEEARFPGAILQHVEDPGMVATRVRVDPWTAVLIMTHHLDRDRRYLEVFLPTEPGYLGCVGPRARLDRLLSDIPDRAGMASRVRGPAGLDLGAEEPAEIAVSIVAEILAVMRGRSGGPLHFRPGPIHDR
jgi:xanthine dehydrogenase accessory factor